MAWVGLPERWQRNRGGWLPSGAVHFFVLVAVMLGVLRPVAADNTWEKGAWTLYMPLVAQPGPPQTDGRPSWSAPLALSPESDVLWVVNPDANSISIVDVEQLTKTHELSVEDEPWALAVSPTGETIYVANRASGTLSVIDAATKQVRTTVHVGPEPGGIALSPRGTLAYVTVTAANAVAVIDTARLTVTAQISVAALPFAIAVSDDGDSQEDDERIYITHLLAQPRPGGDEATDDGRVGYLTVIDTASHEVVDVVELLPDDHGFPNVLSGIALDGVRAWAPHVRAAPALPNGLTSTVFAAVAVVDQAANREVVLERLLLNDEVVFGSPVNNPVAAIPSPAGDTLYVVLAGSDLVEVIVIADPMQPQLVKFIPVGKNPRGMAISRDGARGYVFNYLGRSVTTLDLVTQSVITETATTAETLAPAVLRGKVLFNNAVDPRLSRGSWISCASCHPDGGTDGVTWFFPDGPRQTPPLWNAGQTLPWHWSAALDEFQDVEETIQIIQHGLGLAPGADPPLLGAPLAGKSSDLDSLAAFMQHGIRIPKLPAPASAATLGRQLFTSTGCADCHGGAHWTVSSLPGAAGALDPDGNGVVDAVLRDVGTANPNDIRGGAGFDVPSLLGVGLTAPYFHDGSMPTLEALLASGHPAPDGVGNGLNADEIAALAGFLRSIGGNTVPVEE